MTGEVAVHYQDVFFHSVLPDCLIVSETTGIEVPAVVSLFERICGDFLTLSARSDVDKLSALAVMLGLSTLQHVCDDVCRMLQMFPICHQQTYL